MTHPPLHFTAARVEDFDELGVLLSGLFHDGFDADSWAVEKNLLEPERTLLVRAGTELVASATAYTRELTVPGARLPAAHVSMVGVAPTHRRRGLLTDMMRRQLREVRDAGREPVAVLWASEARIYPRFGYGMAAQRLFAESETTELRLPPPTPAEGRLRLARPADCRTELAQVYEGVRQDRPGWSSRSEVWWGYVLADPPAQRGGATERRVVLHEGPDGVDGYALFRTRSDWDAAGPKAVTTVDEVVTDNPAAYLAMWRMLLSLDLTRRLTFRTAAPDEPLLLLVNEPRRLGARLVDGLWLRVVDLPAALAARRYATPLDVVLEVTDDLLPENTGRWRLTGGPDGATCVPSDEPAGLGCDVRCLGELYLGGVTVGALAAAGRVRELRPGVLASTGPAFGWHRAPTGMEVF
ncbi:GNAT family N-acetyltransferase [Micromonospora sp. WMMA1363]|uniref:GNAT family N-acetyltransferase n=1 Tax=Micromonospora sp. WMMA1363 TaxID=3053985 RepID=UPI00259D09D9|nr:GNAT family N-acetyltransferase [Micromonospora sp. WMMA1363]MDM4720378.1 GNAT family N-acetyltransferase [Micromonospora sp. WMMA1363]